MLSTDKQTDKQTDKLTNQRYQKHNLLCQGGNEQREPKCSIGPIHSIIGVSLMDNLSVTEDNNWQ